MQLLFTIILSLFIGPTTVSAALIRVIFNNGVELSNSPCSTMDDMMIDSVLRLTSRELSMSNDTVTRGLASFSDKCKALCIYVKSCRVSGCFGFDGTVRKKKNRSLQLHTSECTSRINTINTKLDSLPVSSSCKDFIHSSKRQCECVDQTLLGAITGAKLWVTSGSQTASNLTATGRTTCLSQSVTIEALTNGCVMMVNFSLKGPYYIKSGYSMSSPYALFGVDSTGKLIGAKLPRIGTYTVTIKPDNLSDKAQQFSFQVLDC